MSSSSRPDDAPDVPHRRLGGTPPPDAPDMLLPEPPPAPPPEPAPARRGRPRRSRTALIAVIAVLAALALGGSAAAFVFLGEDETAAPEYTALGTDLTEDLGPFDPAQNSGYHPFTFEQRAWLPTPQGRHWVFQGQDDATATFHQDLAEDTVILICGDLRHHLGRYPADFTDREAWFAAEQSREREHRGEGDEYTIAAGPEYGDYVIDGRQAFLVEIQHHWTQWDDPEEGPVPVDYTRAHAYLYIDLEDQAPARCTVTAHHGVTDGYDAALDALLGVRLETAAD